MSVKNQKILHEFVLHEHQYFLIIQMHNNENNIIADFEIVQIPNGIHYILKNKHFPNLTELFLLNIFQHKFNPQNLNYNQDFIELNFGEEIVGLKIPIIKEKISTTHQQIIDEDKQYFVNEIQNLKFEIVSLKQRLSYLENFIPNLQMISEQSMKDIKFDSILIKDAMSFKTIHDFFNNKKIQFNLLFRASRDGYFSENFHSHCDYKGPCLIIIKPNTTCYCIGGYCEKDFDQNLNGFVECKKGFLFSLKTKIKYTLNQGEYNKAYYFNSSCGPTFGRGYDIFISGKGNTGYSKLGFSYGSQQGVKQGSKELADSIDFMVEDYEVFQVKYL